MQVKIENMPERVNKFIVCRVCNGELWYWGSFDDEKTAEQARKEVDGIVVKKGLVPGRNRNRLFEYLNSLSNKELSKVLDLKCKTCPFGIDHCENRYFAACEREIESLLDQDEYLGDNV